jgi:hypothetical protein
MASAHMLAELPAGLRPVLVGDARAIVDGGYTYFDSGTDVHRAPEPLYELYSRVVPHLDGERDLSELTQGLPPARAAAVTRLIGILHHAGLVRDGGPVDRAAAGMPAQERRRWAGELAFLESRLDRPEAAFALVRQADLVISGRGGLSAATAAAALRLGAGRVWLAGPEGGDGADVRRRVAALLAGDPRGDLLDGLRVPGLLDGDLPTRADGYLVLPDGPAAAGSAAAADSDAKGAVLALTVERDVATVRRSPMPGRPVADGAAQARSPWLHGPALTVLGIRAAFAWFCLVTGVVADRTARDPAGGDTPTSEDDVLLSVDLIRMEPIMDLPLRPRLLRKVRP